MTTFVFSMEPSFGHVFGKLIKGKGLLILLGAGKAVRYLLICFENHVIERIWVEVNKTINYSFKEMLIEIVHQNKLDITDDKLKYCASHVLMKICWDGMNVFVNTWSKHRIRKKNLILVFSASVFAITSSGYKFCYIIVNCSYRNRNYATDLLAPYIK